MNITQINIQPEFRGNIRVYSLDAQKSEYIDAKNIKEISGNMRDSSLYLDFLDNNNNKVRRTITIGDNNTKREDAVNNYMRFLQTYSIALQAPADVFISYCI